jgi:pimeloyl-ACP methyl ester carboxylesterase
MKLMAKLFKIILIGFVLLIAIVFVLFGYKDKSVNELKTKYAGAPSAFIAVDGMEVHYRDEGNKADSLPLVLIHGTGSSLQTFDAWTVLLKKERRIIRMDIPAFGLTGPFPDRQYSIEHYVDFIHHFLSAIGVKKCIIGGNSLGGQIAWNFTAQFPVMVQKLILIDAAGYPIQSQSVPIGFKMGRMPVLKNIMTFVTPRFMVKASVENVYADKSKVTEVLVDRYFDLTLREGNRQALVDRLSLVGDTSPVQLIKNIQQPTLILWGEKDLLIPLKFAYNFHNDLPNDTLIILKNAGHVPMEESSKESLAPLLEFLKR